MTGPRHKHESRGAIDRFFRDIEAVPGLVVLAESPDAGLCLVEDTNLNNAYMFNHLEYDTETLAT